MKAKTFSCGIDFGTSNSALAVAGAAGVTLAQVEGQSVTLPSAIFYPGAGNAFFGRQAMQLFIEGEEGRFMRSLKRILGTALMGQGTVVNGRMRKFDDILADFIGHMKATAEKQLNASLESVVMGRPVHFADNDPGVDSRAQAELEKIARAIGFKNVEFQYEPIAAAFAHERKLTGEKLALVADIGGGTSDFTVIRLSKNAMDKEDRKGDILANSGVRIGGNDFDKDLCMAAFMPHFGYGTTYGTKHLTLPVSPFHDMSEWSKINFLYTPKNKAEMQEIYAESHDRKTFGRYMKVLKDEMGHRLLSVVEDNKISLTEREEAEAALGFIEEGFSVNVARGAFNLAVGERVQGISRSIDECLRQAGVPEDKIELIVLTGGTAEVPVLKDRICGTFPHAQVSEEDKLSSVGLGLGYDSARKFQEK